MEFLSTGEHTNSTTFRQEVINKPFNLQLVYKYKTSLRSVYLAVIKNNRLLVTVNKLTTQGKSYNFIQLMNRPLSTYF